MPIDKDIFRDDGQQSSVALDADIFKDSAAAKKPFTPVDLSFAKTVSDEYKSKNWADRQLIASGLGLSNLIQGARQFVGKGDPSTIAANKAIAQENPGMSIAGNLAMVAPTMMIPGLNTYTGATAFGGMLGAAQPTVDNENIINAERLKNFGFGAAGGAGGKYLGDKAGAFFNAKIAEKAAQQSINAPRDAILSSSRQAGYVVPRSEIAPSLTNNLLESFGGKAAIRQQATLANQNVTNALGRKVIGLSDDAPITTGAIENFRAQAAEPYRQIAALDARAANALEKLKDVRAESKAQWAYYNRSLQPQAMRDAKALDQKADMIERVIEQIAQKKGSPGLVEDLREARKAIAQSYDLQRATNPALGDVSARVIGRLAEKGKPLSGELRAIADFQQAFPKFAGNRAMTQAPDVSAFNPMAMTGMGALGSVATGSPSGLLAAGIPLLRSPIRSMLLSAPYQNMGPSYAPSLLTRGTGLLSQQLPMAGAYGAIESFR